MNPISCTFAELGDVPLYKALKVADELHCSRMPVLQVGLVTDRVVGQRSRRRAAYLAKPALKNRFDDGAMAKQFRCDRVNAGSGVD